MHSAPVFVLKNKRQKKKWLVMAKKHRKKKNTARGVRFDLVL